MVESELTRPADDRHRYDLEGVGTLHVEGTLSRRATVEAGGRRWSIGRHRFWHQLRVTDAAGTVVRAHEPRFLRPGG
jgi:hypothetical protein